MGTISKSLSEIKVLDHGLVALTRVDGDDMTPAEAARTSFNSDITEYTDKQNADLVDYLIRHKHTTPLEFCGAVFYMVMPIQVARQLVRHRTFSINEMSLRYVKPLPYSYVPARSRMNKQSTNNKQGSSSEIIDCPIEVEIVFTHHNEMSQLAYEQLLECGVAKELARGVLSVNQYTAWYWHANLHNILHFLKLRLDPHAQEEIRMYAQAMLDQLEIFFPNIIASWKNHTQEAITFSRDEWLAIRNVWFSLYEHGLKLKSIITQVEESARAAGLSTSRCNELLKKLQLD